jgi:hypothetical protein
MKRTIRKRRRKGGVPGCGDGNRGAVSDSDMTIRRM